MHKYRYLLAGLAVVTLFVAGIGFTSAAVQAGSRMAGGTADGSGTGSMMRGGMMGGGGMGSMMGSANVQPMGSFDEDEPFDLQFIDQMTMHHEGAIMSSEHMISDSKRPELRKLAASIEKSQSEQVYQMQAWRKDWYPNSERTFGMMDPTRMEEMMGGTQMENMMGGSMQKMMGGDATDEMFLRMMIPHHQMAVDMSEKALEDAEHPELKDLARKIRDEQSAEIVLMKRYLEEIESSGN
ncbi:MAG: DUF305 domain-containing protein [Rubrobacteraceae bacterium]|nr:DUF305 domain-containing protein [Rubrobacteraceae bacterium]